MNRIEIIECTDIEALKKLCLEFRKQFNVIGEILVDESKWHISADQAVTKIREYLVSHQYDLELEDSE